MGLDMYVFVTDQKLATDVDVDEDTIDPDAMEELHYWRKHPNLHGWMERLYYDKGGKSIEFNCVPLKLDEDDIQFLKAAIVKNRLPRTEGFFFGASDGSEQEDDLQFIAKARAALACGKTIFYFSSW